MNVEANDLELISIDLCLIEFNEAPVICIEQIKLHKLIALKAFTLRWRALVGTSPLPCGFNTGS